MSKNFKILFLLWIVSLVSVILSVGMNTASADERIAWPKGDSTPSLIVGVKVGAAYQITYTNQLNFYTSTVQNFSLETEIGKINIVIDQGKGDIVDRYFTYPPHGYFTVDPDIKIPEHQPRTIMIYPDLLS